MKQLREQLAKLETKKEKYKGIAREQANRALELDPESYKCAELLVRLYLLDGDTAGFAPQPHQREWGYTAARNGDPNQRRRRGSPNAFSAYVPIAFSAHAHGDCTFSAHDTTAGGHTRR